MPTPEPTNEVLLFILEWIWIPVLTIVLWLVRKVFGIEAVQARFDERMDHVESAVNRVDKTNTEQHKNLEDKIDAHNDRVTKRLDSLLTIARNGSGKS